MALPQRVLFPRAHVPVRIFEERYRRMLKDSLASHRMFCIGTLCDDGMQEAVYSTMGLGLIRVAVDHGDGTSHLLLQGVARVKVLEMRAGKIYARATIEPLHSVVAGRMTMSVLVDKLAELIRIRNVAGNAVPAAALNFLAEVRDPVILCDSVAQLLVRNWMDQQLVLEVLNVRERIHLVTRLLQKEIEYFKEVTT